jgi:hypothetical protein
MSSLRFAERSASASVPLSQVLGLVSMLALFCACGGSSTPASSGASAAKSSTPSSSATTPAEHAAPAAQPPAPTQQAAKPAVPQGSKQAASKETAAASAPASSKQATSAPAKSKPAATSTSAPAQSAAPATSPATSASQAPKPGASSAASTPAPSAAAPTSAQAPSKIPPQLLESTLAQIATRSDLWPKKATLGREFRFSKTEAIPKGKELAVQNLQGANLVLDSGKELFECPIKDTDFLDRARTAISAMTPEELALTEQELAKHPELWPIAVTVTSDMQFQNGTTIASGREVPLRGIAGDEVRLYDRQAKSHFTASIHETDVIKRARERMKLAEKDRRPYFLRAVEAAIEKDGKPGAENALAATDLLVVYRARKGCTRCAGFLPELKKLYEAQKPSHPGFEVVFLSADPSAELAHEYVAESKPPGYPIAYDRMLEAGELGSVDAALLPIVSLYDRDGKLLARNDLNGGAPSAADMLAEIQKRLK